MTKIRNDAHLDSKQKRSKGSLAGALVRWLSVFNSPPSFAIMAGAVCFRALLTIKAKTGKEYSGKMIYPALRLLDRGMAQ